MSSRPTGLESTASAQARKQRIISPDAALAELIDGNRRFATGRVTARDHDASILKQHAVEKQQPFAAVLSCADSRVPVEFVFDQDIGQLFVTRVAGNVVAAEIIATLEFGAAVLSTKVILVMGHSSCGAIEATIKNTDAPGQISALYPHIRPAVDLAGPHPEEASKANAKIQAALLRERSTVISGLIQEGKLKVVSGYYDLGTGVVTLLD